MTANELMIVRDYLMRKRWYYLGGFVIHLVAMTGCFWGGKPMMFGIFGGNALILMRELNRGGNATTRTILSLPVAADQLARCWRFVALEFPAVFFLAALLLAAAIGAAFHAPRLTAELLLLLAVAQTLLLGMLYFTLTGLPGQPRTGATIGQHVRDVFFGAIWGLSIPASLFLFQSLPGRFSDFGRGQIAAGILLAAGTVAGWLRADVLVRERAARPGSGNRKAAEPAQNRSTGIWKRFGALPYLCARLASTLLLMMLAILLINRIWMGLLYSGPKGGIHALMPQIWMLVALSVFVSVTQMLSQLRVIRTMPIRTSTLTHLLLFWPIAVAMILGLLALAMFSLLDGAPIDWKILRHSLFGAVFLELMLPLTLRYGLRPWTAMPVVALASMGSIFTSLPNGWGQGIHWLWPLAGACAFLTFIWRSTCRLLGTPHPWSAGAMRWHVQARRM